MGSIWNADSDLDYYNDVRGPEESDAPGYDEREDDAPAVDDEETAHEIADVLRAAGIAGVDVESSRAGHFPTVALPATGGRIVIGNLDAVMWGGHVEDHRGDVLDTFDTTIPASEYDGAIIAAAVLPIIKGLLG